MNKIKKGMRLLVTGILTAFATVTATSCRAQDQELEQLALDIEKLAQFKSILKDIEQGYQILSQGYGAVKSIAQGSFNLHQAFLDGLLAVSPAVRNYYKIKELLSDQASILSEYKSAERDFSNSGGFSPAELNYLGSVYGGLTRRSAQNLEELLTILTAGKLRMSDAERLQAIDRLHSDTREQLVFLRDFNRRTQILAIQRQRELNDLQTTQNLYHHE